MSRLTGAIVLVCGLITGVAGGYWYAHQPAHAPAPQAAAAADRKIVYYRDPSGAPY